MSLVHFVQRVFVLQRKLSFKKFQKKSLKRNIDSVAVSSLRSANLTARFVERRAKSLIFTAGLALSIGASTASNVSFMDASPLEIVNTFLGKCLSETAQDALDNVLYRISSGAVLGMVGTSAAVFTDTSLPGWSYFFLSSAILVTMLPDSIRPVLTSRFVNITRIFITILLRFAENFVVSPIDIVKLANFLVPLSFNNKIVGYDVPLFDNFFWNYFYLLMLATKQYAALAGISAFSCMYVYGGNFAKDFFNVYGLILTSLCVGFVVGGVFKWVREEINNAAAQP
jgi:hypothetical protein